MGIMDQMSTTQSPPSENWGLTRVVDWHLHFCLWPRRCLFTDQRLWFKLCYKGTRRITGPGTDVIVDYYIDKIEFLIWQLKRNA